MDHPNEKNEKNIDILSFDGGGSRGIMELSILNDVLRMATLVLRQPETVKSYLVNDGNKENSLKSLDIRRRLIDDLKAVTDPIHPTDVYEMIVGTSTGALIAFGLVGGNKVGEDHKRAPMSVEQCIKMYLDKTGVIFKKSWFHRFVSHIPGLSSIPLTTYSKDNVKQALIEQFGDSSLEDFGEKCVAGAVARKLGNEEELVLFDTRSEDYRLYKTYQILLASSNAPVYFDTPVRIGSDDFVDGGVGGNCPLAQAIPRAKELFGKKITSVLSVAPPSSSRTEVPRRFQIKYWLNYFVNESTDGYAVFRDVAKRNRHKKTLFQRLSPRGEGLKVFKLDEIDAQKMLDAMEREKENNDMFLIDVVATAMAVVFTSISKAPECKETTLKVAAQLAQTAGCAYQSEKEYEPAISSYKTSLRLYEKSSESSKDQFVISKIYYEIAKCLKEQGKYQLAIESFGEIMEFLDGHQNENSATLFADGMIDLADCYLLTFRYEKAETCIKESLEKVVMPKTRLREFLEKDVMVKKLARALSNMAWCQQEQGKLDEAVKQYRQAKEYARKNDNDKAEILNDLGICFISLRKIDEALNLIRQAQEIRSSQGNIDLKAESLNNVALCLMEKGDYEQAHENLTKAHEMYTNTGNDTYISIVLKNLARCLSLSNKDHDQALAYAQQALEKMTKQVGDSRNPGIAGIWTIVGLCLFRAERFKDAEENLLRSLTIAKNFCKSEKDPRLLDIYEILSALYEKEEKQNEAKFCEAKAKSIRDKIEEMARNIGEH